MGDTIVSLLPMIIGSAVVPAEIIMTILMLKNRNQGLPKALAFFAGITTTRLLQGVMFGLIFNNRLGSSTDEANGRSLILSTILLILGILLLIAAYKKWDKEQDPDAPPPKWMTAIDRAAISKTFMFGFALPLINPKLWVFILGAIAQIAEAELGQFHSIVVFLIFVLCAQSLILLPILIRILIPKRSIPMLEATSAWLERYNRPIVIVVSLVFGVYFFYQGLSGLI